MKPAAPRSVIPPKQADTFLEILKTRCEENRAWNPALKWPEVQAKLVAHPHKLWALHEMERTGGQPCLVASDKKAGSFVFFDCSPESPQGRRSVCYDREGWESRKEHRPKTNAMDMAAAMGVDLLSEEQYLFLQTLGEFDLKTSSWLATPPDFRARGGALFGDRRFGRTFVYHNGAQSYYSARGFRAALTL